MIAASVLSSRYFTITVSVQRHAMLLRKFSGRRTITRNQNGTRWHHERCLRCFAIRLSAYAIVVHSGAAGKNEDGNQYRRLSRWPVWYQYRRPFPMAACHGSKNLSSWSGELKKIDLLCTGRFFEGKRIGLNLRVEVPIREFDHGTGLMSQGHIDDLKSLNTRVGFPD